MVKIRSVQNPLDWSFLEYLRSGKTRQKALPPAAEATRLPWVLEDWVRVSRIYKELLNLKKKDK